MTFGLGAVAALLFFLSCGICVAMINWTAKHHLAVHNPNASDSRHDLAV